MYTHTYICIHTHVCVCMCVCVLLTPNIMEFNSASDTNPEKSNVKYLLQMDFLNI